MESFSFGGKAYSLSAAGAGSFGSGAGTTSTLTILDGSTAIGTIVQGSAVVGLNAGFLDTLADGTYAIKLGFADTYTLKGGEIFFAEGTGTHELIIQRGGSGTTPTNPTNPAVSPQTGDSLLPLWLALILASGGLVCLCVWSARLDAPRRKKR